MRVAAVTAVARVRERVRFSHVGFLLNFALAKAAIYVIPLLLAAFSSDRLYGRIELGLAIGLQSSALVLGASLSGATQLYLIRDERGFGAPLVLLTVVPTGTLLIAAITTWLAGSGTGPVLVIATISATILQNTASAWFRMRGQRNHTAWADGTSLLIVGIAALLAVLIEGRDAVGLAAVLVLAATTAAVVASLATLWRHGRNGDLIRHLRRATLVGLPMMVAGVFSIWIGVGGRILVGFLSPADLAVYSLSFRIAGLTVGLHQLATTAIFPRLYASRVRPGDRLMSLFVLAVLGVSILLLAVAPFLPRFIRFSALNANSVGTFQALIPPAIIQTFFWIGFALLQSRINRFGAAKRSIVPILLVTAIGIGLIILLVRGISSDIRFVAWLIALHAATYYLTAHVILQRRGVPHMRTSLTIAAGGLLLSAFSAISILW